MPVTYTKADYEVRALVKDVMNEHHPELVEVELKVLLLMAAAPKDEHGRPLCDAVKLHGKTCAAVASLIPYKRRAAGADDCEITFDADQWGHMTKSQQAALIDHELYHFVVQRDDEGNPKSDDMGRPKLKIRQHDHDFGWFDVIANRHGDASFEVKQAKAFADQAGQTYFGWAAPPDRPIESLREAEASDGQVTAVAMSKPMARATKDLASLVGNGLDSITLSTPGSKPVVINAAAAERIRKNCDTIIDGKATAPPVAPADAPPDTPAATEPEQPTADATPGPVSAAESSAAPETPEAAVPDVKPPTRADLDAEIQRCKGLGLPTDRAVAQAHRNLDSSGALIAK